MVLYPQFLPMNFLIFALVLAESISFQMDPGSSRWFQLVRGGSSFFHAFPACSRWFQLVPRSSFVSQFDHFFILVLQQIVESRAQFAAVIL